MDTDKIFLTKPYMYMHPCLENAYRYGKSHILSISALLEPQCTTHATRPEPNKSVKIPAN